MVSVNSMSVSSIIIITIRYIIPNKQNSNVRVYVNEHK